MRGLTGFELVLFHPNTIKLWLGIIGLGCELVMLLLHMRNAMLDPLLYLLMLQMYGDIFILV